MTKYVLNLLILFTSCTPISYQTKNIDNPIYLQEGFLTKNIYQTICSVKINFDDNDNNRLVNECKEKTILEWANFKYFIDEQAKVYNKQPEINNWRLAALNNNRESFTTKKNIFTKLHY